MVIIICVYFTVTHFFTLIGLGAGLTLGDGGAEGGMGFILGGLGGCGGVGAIPGFPGIPFVLPPGVL